MLAVLLPAGDAADLATGATIRVPQDVKAIQAAVDRASAGDTVLVAAGTYRERVRLKEGVTLRSAGDDARGALGLKRAEGVILDGGGRDGDGPGVAMAEGSTLDGLTVTNVGRYDDVEWKKHHATQGNEQPHEHIGLPGTAGVSVIGVDCTVRHNIVHHVGYTGIAIQGVAGRTCTPLVRFNVCYRNMGGGIGSMQGSTAIIEGNVCFQNFYAGIGHEGAAPLVVDNECYENIRAGIGVSEGAKPVVRGNKCYRNRRAGIGVRTDPSTAPTVEDNDCYENDMAGIGCDERCAPLVRGNRCHDNGLAGIGCRDGARPMIVGNKCYRNRAAGIGSEDEAQPLITDNECFENETAGIGQRGDTTTTLVGNHAHHNKASGIGFDECEAGRSRVVGNRVVDNEKTAVGIHAGWKVELVGNELSRSEGLPPIAMVFRGAEATFTDNRLRGGGVAAIRSEGTVRAANNRFECAALRVGGPPQFAVWGLPGSEIAFTKNSVTGWRHAIVADQATVTACDNRVADYGQPAFKIDRPTGKPVVVGNHFVSEHDRTGVVVTGGEAIVADNFFEVPGPSPAEPSPVERRTKP